MPDTPFITRPMSIVLDLARVVAALAVLIGHAVQLGHYNGSYPFTIIFQHNAVIVFFVLSGLVIAASVDRGGQTLGGYALARVTRILPVALPALLVSMAVMAINAAIAPDAIFAEDETGVSASKWLSALLFVSESYQTGFAPNPPYWSLCYEVWFYALFAAATFLDGWKRLAWLAALAVIAGPNVLLLLPVWLVGVGLARLPQLRRIPAWLGASLVLVAVAGLYLTASLAPSAYLAIRDLVPWRLGGATFAVTDLVLAIAIAAGFAGLRRLTLGAGSWLERLEKPIRYAANMTFSLYLLHWPLLKLLRVLRAPDESTAGFAFVLIVILVVSAGFASVTEHHRDRTRRLLERALPGRPEALAT
jgi:peptidoglycan/LPS O-acetylase OafA/YrhL